MKKNVLLRVRNLFLYLKCSCATLLILGVIFIFIAPCKIFAQANLIIRDDANDSGTEPNPNNVAMWLSPDIWVRQIADDNYDPNPFTGSPSWNPLTHEDAEYRDPTKYSVPNWVYVKVTNVGNASSAGTEVLKLYWSKSFSKRQAWR